STSAASRWRPFAAGTTCSLAAPRSRSPRITGLASAGLPLPTTSPLLRRPAPRLRRRLPPESAMNFAVHRGLAYDDDQCGTGPVPWLWLAGAAGVQHAGEATA